MKDKSEADKPETIDNHWDILYRDYPEVYEAFSNVEEKFKKDLGKMFRVKGKIVIDIGSGTGKSTFPFAPYAKQVIGIEPEEAMLKIAEENLKSSGLQNVVFRKGSAEQIPLENKSADMIISITGGYFSRPGSIEKFTAEAERVLVSGGSIFVTRVAPGWYGGELASEILKDLEFAKGLKNSEYAADSAFVESGFSHRDYYTTQQYDSVEHIISTYGFIHGKRAIEYLKAHNKTSIKWKYRVYHKRTGTVTQAGETQGKENISWF